MSYGENPFLSLSQTSIETLAALATIGKMLEIFLSLENFQLAFSAADK
jgi:hypothetical protein